LSNQYEPYNIKVTNPSNLFGLLPNALYVNASPVWQTASGSLGTFNEQVSISISATATDSDSTITYALASGSTLPSGVTLNSSTGVISGTLPNIASNTTYNFTINASDGINSIVPRSFSISSVALFPTGGTITTSGSYRVHTFTGDGSFTVPVPISVEYLIVAGGGGGGSDGDVGGGGGGGGLLTGTASISAQTYNIVVGAGGTKGSKTWSGSDPDFSGAGVGTQGGNGGNSSFNNLVAIGGGGGGTRGQSGRSGGSGGGGGDDSNSGGSGTSGQGFNGGNGPGMNTQGGNDSGGGGGAGGAASNNIPGPGLFNAIGNATFAKGGRGIQINTASDSAPNTGDGGAGVRNGGSGIVVIRYIP
jgi:hypothetical protein